MNDREVIIDIKDVKKQYKLGQIGSTTLQHRIQSWWAEKTGKDDPNERFRFDSSKHISGDTLMALNGVSLKIYRGESVGIIGKNGAGKSTLLKLLSRVTAPTEGSIDIYGRIASMLEVGTGFDAELTGRENIYLNGAILGMNKPEIDSKMEEIIEFSEVRDFIDTPVKRYSSGMYSKLAFSVAAHLDSDIMIMDEVLAVGDAAFQTKCIETMKKAVEDDDKTVLYVSHNMNQIRQLCSRCIVLQEGKVIFDGDVERAIEIYTERSMDESKSLDYTSFDRPDWLDSYKVRTLYAKYLNDSNVFGETDVPKVEIGIIANRKVRNIGLKIEVKSQGYVGVGVFLVDGITSLEEGEKATITVEYDVSALVDGVYLVTYCFYERDEYGNTQNLDWVPGLSFVRENNVANNLIKWDAGTWGNISFNEYRVIKVEVENNP